METFISLGLKAKIKNKQHTENHRKRVDIDLFEQRTDRATHKSSLEVRKKNANSSVQHPFDPI